MAVELLEKKLDMLAADLVLLSVEDLPALARLHESFLQLAADCRQRHPDVEKLIRECSTILEKIVLNEVSDKASQIERIGNTISTLQKMIRDGRGSSEGGSPARFNDAAASSGCSSSKLSENSKLAISKGQQSESEASAQKDEVVYPPEKATETAEELAINLQNSDSALLVDFINEAREHCAVAEQKLMDIEAGTDIEGAIHAIFRSFHTIKGAAGFLELKPILVLAHESETVLDLARKGSLTISGPIADIIFDAVDTMRHLLEGVESALKSDGYFDGASLTIPRLERLRKIIADPAQSNTMATSSRVGDILIEMGAVSQQEIDSALSRKEKPDEKLGETLVRQGVVPAKVVAHALREQQQLRSDKTPAAVKEMVRIDTDRLDRLVDTIGELVVAESMVGQDDEILKMASPKIARNISHLNKITRELQEMGMAMRLVPVKPTFQKLARAVRDLNKKSGKEVELAILGEETEVDRSIVENIGDPLMHMIRNAVDHGIESPEERVKAGKNRTGKITVRAYHKGGNIFFDIEDDGRGLNKEKILEKAKEKGLFDGERELSDKEIFGLILLPGFSTAAKVTDLSGRGVGMDVVRKNVDAMRGHLEINSTPGKGTLISMKLPLTLAIIDGMLVKVEKECFIIPTLSIVESLRLSKEMIKSVVGRGEMVELRGDLLTLIRINELFGISHDSQDNRPQTVVVVEDGFKRVGLVVDELLGQRQTVIKNLGSTFGSQKWIAGGAILSNGNVGLIIDVGGIISLASEINWRHDGETDKKSVADGTVRNAMQSKYQTALMPA
ncbi:MAG: chemotaxis protein CheA [bacterium]|jgi:two-component system chemotaxis sensor kinase CheA